MATRLQHLTSRLQGFGTTIFAEMTRIAAQHEAVNLGQGFPDFDPPETVRDAAVRAIRDGHNQYAPGTGLPALRAAVAAHQRRFWGLDYDAETEVTVTAGATEAVCATLQALCETGDEVVLFEPFYDSYLASVAMAGATPRVVTLRSPGFDFDPDDLDAVVTPKTRVLVLNSPHNPSGTVFDRAQLDVIAGVCVERDLIAVTDEVYEHMVYDGEHVPLASLPGMRERTVTISSAGKTFSVTGWKVGWACAAPPLSAALRTAKQFMTFTNGTPFQHAITEALALPDAFFTDLCEGYRARRDRLVAGLGEAGFTVHVPAGSYFATVDITSLGYDDDVEFCLALPAKVGVAGVPCSGFYLDRRRGRHLVRFAFCKTDALLDEALDRLRRLPSRS